GGGFEFVNGAAVTSRHNVRTSSSDPGESQPWGYQARTGEKSGVLAQPLTCTSCHNPHGSPNYRMLLEQVNSFTVSVLAYGSKQDGTTGFTKQEGGPGLDTPNYPNIPSNKYVADYYGSTGEIDSAGGVSETGGYQPTTSLASQPGDPAKNAFALLCGACHTTYPSNWGRGLPPDDPYGLANSPAKYRHRTEMRYDRWLSPKYDDNPVPNNPETNPYNPGSGPLPPLRLASNGIFPNKIVTCLTCHRAHGTATQMTGWALSTALGGSSPDELSPAQTSASRSTLLVLSNREMCEACHQW
ncbi:MAG: cytochrome c3 family protein, partial [Chloroflexi bacterium]|nr:cytochrome c3 family protein [Chloroflexota bacterium]